MSLKSSGSFGSGKQSVLADPGTKVIIIQTPRLFWIGSEMDNILFRKCLTEQSFPSRFVHFLVTHFFLFQIEEVRALLGPLPDRLSLYCSDACIRRYLTARNWNVKRAVKMLKGTLKWRLEYKPEDIRWVSNLLFLIFTWSNFLRF